MWDLNPLYITMSYSVNQDKSVNSDNSEYDEESKISTDLQDLHVRHRQIW